MNKTILSKLGDKDIIVAANSHSEIINMFSHRTFKVTYTKGNKHMPFALQLFLYPNKSRKTILYGTLTLDII